MGRAAMPQGVDLNLDEFDLTTSQVVPSKVEGDSSEACAPLGSDFFSNIFSESGSAFRDEDKNLLRAIFNPRLSDRHEEGNCFVPPETGFEYVQKLRSLAKEEEAMRQRRKEYFFSEKFAMDEPGDLYPSTWKSAFEITQGATSTKNGLLQKRLSHQAEAAAFDHMLKTATPVFDKSSEDGIQFRIYKFGSLEVRTTQKPNDKEIIGVVFSLSPSVHASTQTRSVNEKERVVKATEYVERANRSAGYQFYTVLETEYGNMIASAALEDGSMSWEENPKDLEDHNSLAKVLRSADCSHASITVGEMEDGSVNWQQLCTTARQFAKKAMLD
eukprot:gnl/TRDRNA2_/TRDRNA2_173791_c1_seq3.p1 gnl/TRDRNA2_/TRDRNA2_173791_c1~~gnl/TRDRNA2_/TRDRNA2_173791_c1_seq3.p1  ORF type:complete len:359 (-),score=80.07 gnl/TRDRNA2_/TRDRNA2_173791_c1_seq3:57-1043(-)